MIPDHDTAAGPTIAATSKHRLDRRIEPSTSTLDTRPAASSLGSEGLLITPCSAFARCAPTSRAPTKDWRQTILVGLEQVDPAKSQFARGHHVAILPTPRKCAPRPNNLSSGPGRARLMVIRCSYVFRAIALCAGSLLTTSKRGRWWRNRLRAKSAVAALHQPHKSLMPTRPAGRWTQTMPMGLPAPSGSGQVERGARPTGGGCGGRPAQLLPRTDG